MRKIRNFFLVRIPIQNPNGTLAFPDYKRTAKYEAHRRLSNR
jgi:hypothetical protein